VTARRKTLYDDQIPPDLWVEFPRADLRLRLIEAVLTIARLRGATSLDVQEALSVKWDRPSDDFGLRRTLSALPDYDLAHMTVQPIVLHQKIGLFRLTERGRTLARALGVEPLDNGWDTLVRTHQGEKQVRHAALLLYTDRLARERGWLTELTPSDAHAGYFPDLWINAADAWSMDVEVEGRWWAHSHHWDKWRAVGRAQGFAAIVARTAAVRKRLVQSCRSAGVPGVATDLETLRLRDGPWWLEGWNAPFGSIKTWMYLQSLTQLQ
jgi:hypothetical protein